MGKFIVAGVIFVTAIVALPLLLPETTDTAPESSPMLPWQIMTNPDGSAQVFGLQPGQSTIEDARALFGPDVEIAIVAPPARSPLLEAYYENINAGFITGKLILTVDIDQESLSGMRARALKEKYMESVTRKVTLHPDDLAEARRRPIRVITFIPSADLDEEIVTSRFGAPDRRIRLNDETEHFLYPASGVDIALNRRGKEVLQYVAPADFALLLEPLLSQIAQTPEQHNDHENQGKGGQDSGPNPGSPSGSELEQTGTE